MNHVHRLPGFDRNAEAFRAEVCAWLTQRLGPERIAGRDDPTDRTGLSAEFGRELQREAGDRGWLGISLPAAVGGGGRPPSYAAAFGYEAAYHDAPLVDTAIVLAGAPILAFGAPTQLEQMLPAMLAGELEMCIAYTEPQAGNDLAALSSVAEPASGGGFVLSGHKTLITAANKADLCLTVARTDLSVPVRRGTSMFLVEMSRPGVTVVPRRTMAGYDLWDVVFEHVALPAEALLGKKDEGWRQLAYAVEQERTGVFSLGWCDRLFDELLTFVSAEGDGARLVDDPVVADRLAQLWIELQDGRRSAVRLLTEEMSGRRSPAAASAAKVLLTELAQRLAQFATEVAGPEGSIAGTLFGQPDPAAPARGRFGHEYLFRFDGPVAVGANELHRSGIAASALGITARPRPAAPDVEMSLDLLADGHPIRDEVRGALAAWQLAQLPRVQRSATGYEIQLWTSLLRVWPAVTTSGDVRVVAEELGRLRCPTPIQSGLASVDWMLRRLPGRGTSQRADLLSGTRFAVALDAVVRGHRETDGSWRLSGDLRHVTFADSAETFLVPVHDGRSTVLVAVQAQAAGVRRQTHVTLSDDRMSDVQLNDVAVSPAAVLAPASSDAERALQAARAAGLVARSAELTGLAAGLLTATVRRVTTRQAFGQPLAAQQSVQQRAADMYLDLQAARDATREAADLLDATVAHAGPNAGLSTEVELALSTAHVTSTAAALRIAAGAHQLCGGWGQLDEAGLHHYTRAIKSAEGQLGPAAVHRATIASLLVGRIPRD